MSLFVCIKCGALAGTGKPCTDQVDGHAFAEVTLPPYCCYCGEFVGTRSTCPVGRDDRHVYVKEPC